MNRGPDHPRGPYYLGEDRRRPIGESPERRAHPVTAKLAESTYRALREEARASGLSLSAVVRLAIREGLPAVTAARVARSAGVAPIAPADRPKG